MKIKQFIKPLLNEYLEDISFDYEAVELENGMIEFKFKSITMSKDVAEQLGIEINN